MRSAFAKIYFQFGYYLKKRGAEYPPTIIYYHRVTKRAEALSEGEGNPHLWISEAVFEKQVNHLCRNTTVISLDDFIGYSLYGERLPENSLLITFDDGYADNYYYALPILRKYRVPATIFLTACKIGSDESFWWDDLYAILKSVASSNVLWASLEKLGWAWPFAKDDRNSYGNCKGDFLGKYFVELSERIVRGSAKEAAETLKNLQRITGFKKDLGKRMFLTWDQVKEMRRNGISFGSHSWGHENLALLSKSDLKKELIQSKLIIEGHLEERICAFSYPYGIYDQRCKRLLAESGYEIAFATRSVEGFFDRFSIPRTPIKENRSRGILGNFSPLLFRAEYSGAMDKLRRNRLPVLGQKE